MNKSEIETELRKIDHRQKEILDESEAFGRMTVEQEQEYDRLDSRFWDLKGKLNRLEHGRPDELKEQPIRPDPSDSDNFFGGGHSAIFDNTNDRIRIYQPGEVARALRSQTRSITSVERRDFTDYLTKGMIGLSSDQKRRFEQRALYMDSDVQGGYLVAPEQFVNQVIVGLNNAVFLRPLSTTVVLKSAHSLGVPALDADPDDPDWTAELKTGTEDTAMKVGKRALHPHPLAKRIKVSNTLLRRNPAAADLVRSRLVYKFSVSEESAFLSGDGSDKPLGLFTASDDGISTDRDVSTDNTTTSIKADNLINCKYTLKAQYRRNAKWIFSREAIKQIRKLKDGDGDYLWKLGLADGRPDTILGMPVLESEYCPATFTTGKYVGILGDFSFYWICDALDMQIQVLDQLYAETNQTGYIGRRETDGMPVLEEAFVRVTLA